MSASRTKPPPLKDCWVSCGANVEGQLLRPAKEPDEGEGGRGAPPAPVTVLHTNPPEASPRLSLRPTEVAHIALGRGHGVLLTQRGEVYCWGENASGQLGNGGTHPLPPGCLVRPTLPPAAGAAAPPRSAAAKAVLEEPVVGPPWGPRPNGAPALASPTLTVAASLQKSASLLSSAASPLLGAAESSGRRVSKSNRRRSAQPAPPPPVAAAVAAGASASYALLADGGVLSWGDNGWAQLGAGEGELFERSGDGCVGGCRAAPGPVVGLPAAAGALGGIAAGEDHALAWSAERGAWSWGGNDAGQLGAGDEAGATGVAHTAAAVVGPLSSLRITAARCGARHVAALDSMGAMWVWGAGDRGQLGPTAPTRSATSSAAPPSHLSVPRKVHGLGTVREVACGLEHTAAVTPAGLLYVWGADATGQVSGAPPVPGAEWGAGGRGAEEDVDERPLGGAPSPPKLEPRLAPRPCAAVQCGDGFTAAQEPSGAWWVWGENHLGQLGTGMVGAPRAPEKCPALRRRAVYASPFAAYLLAAPEVRKRTGSGHTRVTPSDTAGDTASTPPI